MFAPPLNIKAYAIDAFSLKLTEDIPSENNMDDAHADIKAKIDHRISSEDENDHMLILEVAIKPKKGEFFPYSINIIITGIFESDSTLPAEQGAKITYVNGSSILYGAAREYIFTATAHTRFGPFMLPTTSFLNGSKEQKKTSRRK